MQVDRVVAGERCGEPRLEARGDQPAAAPLTHRGRQARRLCLYLTHDLMSVADPAVLTDRDVRDP